MIISTLEAYSDPNGQARQAAVANTVELSNLIPPTVSYESRGHVLLVGGQHTITALAAQFSELTSVTLLVPRATLTIERTTEEATETRDGVIADDTPLKAENLYFADHIRVTGYLGAFSVDCQLDGVIASTSANLAKVAIGRDCFDLIVDLTAEGMMPAEVPAPGYYAIGRGKADLADVIEALPEMLGTFDKPKYFRLDPDACAHASRGVSGCERCLDACPADALSSNGQTIEINPYLCQGVGSCATACPTEAIHYALPDPQNTQHFVHRLLHRYAEAGGTAPVVLFYAKEDAAALAASLAQFETSVIPVALEELASVGVDTWLTALAYGAYQVVLAANIAVIPEKTARVLEDELAIARTLLGELGYDAARIALIDFTQAAFLTTFEAPLATYPEAIEGSKRDKIHAALDILAKEAPSAPTVSELPAHAPFGDVACETTDCTLCMSCVAVCPTRALHAIGDRPGLLFIEQDCVQCGLCEKACPENALTLTPAFQWDAAARQQARVVHEEEAACCTSCGKAFAPLSMVKMLTEKLAAHAQFQGEAIRRLSMCEDCRVRDVFAAMERNPESQLRV